MPWRHRPLDPSRSDLAALARAGLAVLALGLLALLLAGAGCAVQVRPECPLGSRPTKVDTGSGTEGGTSAKGDLPSQSITAGGSWKGSSSADWSCAPICPKGQLLQASEDGKNRSVRCLSERCPEAGPGTSRLPPQEDR